MSRSDRVPLPADEPRCEPSQGCAASTRCARALAAIPRGTALTDYTAMKGGGTVLCDGFVEVTGLRKAAAAAAPAVKPWPKDQA